MENEVKNDGKYKIKTLEKLGFFGFSTATNIAFNFKAMYYLIFLDVVCGLGPGLAGIVLSIGTIWDAINDPLISVFCENRRFKNGEKIRPYALYASIPWAITIVLLFVNFGIESKAITMMIALIIYFVFEALYTFLCMPYNSMASLATKDDYERSSINAYRSLGGCVGSGIGAVAILSLVQLFGGLRDHDDLNASDSTAIFMVAIIMGLLCIAGSLFHYFTSKERVKPENNTEAKISLFKAYKMLFKCKSWRLNMIYIIGYAIIQAFMMNNVNYYALYIKGNSKIATPILAFYLVIAILTSIFVPKLDRKLGRKKLAIISALVAAVGMIPFIILPYSMVTICILSAAVGFGLTTTYIIFNTNRNSCADILEVQNGVRIDSLVAGGDNLITKLSEALAILIMTSIYESLGMDSNLKTQPAIVIKAIIFFLGIASLVVTLLMTLFASKIDTKKELEESIKARDGVKE